MSFNIEKIINILQPTYNQLKGMLISSIAVIGMVYFLGTKTAEFQRTITDNSERSIENSKTITKINKKINQIQIDNYNSMHKLYIDLLDINSRNNLYLNDKFNLMIDYDNNKPLLKNLLKIQDNQQLMYDEKRKKDMEYWIKENILIIQSSINDTVK